MYVCVCVLTQVLAEVGPEGLPISEMASRIHESGLRDFKYTKQVCACSGNAAFQCCSPFRRVQVC